MRTPDVPMPARLIVAAAAGYGKTTMLHSACPDGGVVVDASEVLRAGLPEGAPWVGLDSLDRLSAGDAGRVLELVCSAGVGFAIASRTAVPLPAGGSCAGRTSVRDATDLAMSPWQVARVLAERSGVVDTGVALRVAELTAGWPVLVELAGEALARDPRTDADDALTAPGAAAWEWLHDEVLAVQPSDVVEVLRAAAALDADLPLGPSLVGALAALTGGCVPTDLAGELTRSGLLTPRRRTRGRPELVLVPAVREALRAGPVEVARVARFAAPVLEREGEWLAAAQAHASADDISSVRRLVREHGEDVLRGGGARATADLLGAVTGADLVGAEEDPLIRRTLADALRMSGDPAGARRRFAQLVEAAGPTDWDAGLSARVAALHYLTGEFPEALAALDRCHTRDDPCEDQVDWWAGRVHVLVVLGREEEAAGAAARCLALAEALGQARPRAVAHLAVARTLAGERRDLHQERAADLAREAGDAVTLTRALAARTCHLLAAARYDLALVTGEEAVRMARLSCPPGLRAVTLHNLGEALFRTGRAEEALWHLECSVALCRRLGPARAALGLVGVADVHRALGRREQSRRAYGEALTLSRGSGDAQVLVPALCGLARLVAGDLTDEAADLLAEADALAPPPLRPLVHIGRAELTGARGERAAARDEARAAVAAAREVGAVDWLAEALELEAAGTDDAARARDALAEALSVWRSGGARPAVARLEVLLGRLPGADCAARAQARDAVRRLRAAGLRVPGEPVEGTATPTGAGRVSVQVLGPFEVAVDGVPVPLPAWRSRQARTFVKVLAAHRGRVVTRSRMCDLLWPDDDPARTGHRLSVLMTTVRGVLDPGKAWPPDRYVVADQDGLRLDLRTVVLDADLLLRDAAHAVELLDAGEHDRAREVLAHVDALHRGPAFEDETDEWAEVLRDEVRVAWSASVRRLAALRSREGRGGEALGILVRLLAVDPYDEQVHRRLVTGLVGAGRHGEARQAFERWSRAMREIDAPAPDPRSVGLTRAAPRREPVLTPR
jgi:DNA-binding SARP family transcriptional activator/tetratricopeptide (TPR) repeat protein